MLDWKEDWMKVYGCVLTRRMLLQGVSEMMEQQRHLMQSVLDDTQLNRLRLEGGTVLARFRKEEASENDRYRRVTLTQRE